MPEEPQREAEVVCYAWGSCPSARRSPCFATFKEARGPNRFRTGPALLLCCGCTPAWALDDNTSLVPSLEEQALLERYAQGELTLNQVLAQLDHQVHHVLYRSRATSPLTLEQLTDLLDEARSYNERHALTGLLCYGDGFFIQVLEGAAQEVHTLYAKIQRDPRHRQVVTLSDAASPLRWFADWRMALVHSEPLEMYWLINHLEARHQHLVVPQVPITHPHLLTLLAAFQTQAQPSSR